MREEVVTLTQQGPSAYSKERVLFMAHEATQEFIETDDLVSTKGQDREAKRQARREKAEKKRELATSERAKKVTPQELEKRVQNWQRELEKIVAGSKHIAPEHVQRLTMQEFRNAIGDLQLSDVEKFLNELRDIENLSETVDDAQAQTALKAAIHEKERAYEETLEKTVTERRAKEMDIARESTVGGQVFDQFEKFLGLENVTVQTDSSAKEVEIRTTADGQTIVVVPSASLENMLAVARQLTGEKISAATTESLQSFGKELQSAAVMLYKSGLFHPEAISTLYNSGLQLEQIAKGEKPDHLTSDAVMELLKNPDNRHLLDAADAQEDKLFLDIFLGRHNLSTDQGTRPENLYDVMFKRWLRNETKNNKDVDVSALSLADQQKQFDEYLLGEYGSQERKLGLLRFLRRPIERSLMTEGKAVKLISEKAGEKARRVILPGLLDPWRMLAGENGYKGLRQEAITAMRDQLGGRDLHKLLENARDNVGDLNALRAFNRVFQPGQEMSKEALKYLPSDLAKEMSKQDRDAVACITAIAYEKAVLEEALQGQGFLVVPEIAGTHATLLLVDTQNGQVIRIDPKRAVTDLGAVEALSEGDPVFDAIMASVNEQHPEDERDLLDDMTRYKINIKTKRQIRDADGKVKTVVIAATSGDTLIASALLANMAALDEYWQGGKWEKLSEKEKNELRLRAATEAIKIAPENHIAWAVKATLEQKKDAKDTVEDDMYSSAAYKKAKEMGFDTQHSDMKDLLVGAPWAHRPAGGWVDTGGNPVPAQLAAVLDQADALIGGIADTEDVQPQTLQLILESLNNYRNEAALRGDLTADILSFLRARIVAVSEGIKNNHIQPPVTESRGIPSFNLDEEEQRIYAGNDFDEMRKRLELEIDIFSIDLNPGFGIPVSAATVLQGKFQDIIKILRTNKNSTPTDSAQQVLELAQMYDQMVIQPVQAAAVIESGNAREREGVARQVNGMDNSAGHDVIRNILNLHRGKGHLFAAELARVMEQRRLENVNDIKEDGHVKGKSVGKITPSQYRLIRDEVVDRHRDLAMHNVGMYAADWQKICQDLPYPTGATAAQIADKDEARKIRLTNKINVDAKFAHIEFILDGRASTIGIRGENTAIRDGTTSPFLNDQWNANRRYEQFTPSREAVDTQVRHGREYMYIAYRYGGEVAKQLADLDRKASVGRKLGNKIIELRGGDPHATDLLDRFKRLNEIEHMSASSDDLWSNQFIRTAPMLQAMRDWRNARIKEGDLTIDRDVDDHEVLYGENSLKHQFSLFQRLLLGDPVIRFGGELEITKAADQDVDQLLYDIFRRYIGDPKVEPRWPKSTVGELNDWGSTRKTEYKRKMVRYGLMLDVISQFSPEELMRPFAYEPDHWKDATGHTYDERFVSFFNHDRAKFLVADSFLINFVEGNTPAEKLTNARNLLAKIRRETGARYSGVSADALEAQVRWKIFEEYVVPIMQNIRTQNFNGFDTSLAPKDRVAPDPKNFPPRQTNFGTEFYRDFDDLFGAGASGNLQRMMREMTGAITAVSSSSSHGNARDGRVLDMSVIDFTGPTVRKVNRNSLIGRLAFDPMMDHVLYKAALTIIDSPYWMMHGKDIFDKDHPNDLMDIEGGDNQVGRHLEDAATAVKGREGYIKVIMSNPNQIEETALKALHEEVYETNAGMKSHAWGGEIEGAIAGIMLSMMCPELVEAFGLETLLKMNNSEMRKIYGRRTRALNKEQLKTLYWSQYAPFLGSKENADMMFQFIFGKKLKRRSIQLWKYFYMIMLGVIAESMSVGQEVMQGELKAA